MTEFLPVLIMNARPAAGKSEITHFLQNLPVEKRIARFHIGPVHVLDDFPMLWAWFEEDDILTRVFQRPRLYTTPDGYFLHNDLWHLLIQRLSLEYSKWHRDIQEAQTCLIEFSRGNESGGYQSAYQHLSDQILEKVACLYVNVSYEESVRKNRLRANPDRPDSVLEHSLDEGKMATAYRHDDWQSFSAGDPNYLHIRSFDIPYAIFENEDDVTTKGGTPLAARLEEALGRLWTLWQVRQAV